MKVKYKVFSNLYQDSVSLMQISAQISKLPGIQQASVVMGTPNNLEQLRDAGLGNEINASPNDLVIAVMGEEDICNEALVLAQQRLTSKPDDETDSGIKSPEKVSLEMALEAEPEANLALISVPGDYAAAEAIKALNLGMNVMMFSDNVSIVQEKSIKTLARERQRIVMGPDSAQSTSAQRTQRLTHCRRVIRPGTWLWRFHYACQRITGPTFTHRHE